jgi:UDP-N-acetylmuramoyl-L-alanyl-D-glutamate--2,6-diaminopimelate ligase
VTGRPLAELLAGVPHRLRGDGAVRVRGVSFDSRRVKRGDLFVALPGHRTDGHDHAAGAAAKGAAAVLAQREVAVRVPVAVTPDTVAALSKVSAEFYGHPSRALSVTGVTGTNGKTTITYMLEGIFRQAGAKPGVMGTVEYRWGKRREDASNTTPFSADVQRLLARMRDDGVTHVFMETSSHALTQHRVDDVSFACAVFTNLTRDHLDYHKTMDAYFEAKAGLFDRLADSPGKTRPEERRAVVNADDERAGLLLRRIRTAARTYGVRNAADYRAVDVSLGAEGTRFVLAAEGRRSDVFLPAVGMHNVYNALAAVAAARGLGLSLADAVKGLEALRGVPGRLERVSAGGRGAAAPFSVFVDYAHTDDALQNVLRALRPLTKGRLITVFGCGGDRDKTKRPLMGRTAVTMSDHAVVTSDNPRTEDPARIAEDILEGIRPTGAAHYEVELDRGAAIEKALRRAGPGDVVLVAGKGHETYQIFKDRTVDFDDREVVRAALRRRTGAPRTGKGRG